MAGTLLDTIYRVVGANRVVSANREVAASQRAVDATSRRARAGLLGMTTALTSGFIGVAALGLAMRKVVRDYTAYTRSIAMVNTTLTSASRNVAGTSRLVVALADNVAVDLGYSLAESNANMNTMLETGIEVSEAMRVFRTATELARVGNMELGGATQFLTDTMNQFRGEQARGNEESGHFARRVTSQLVVGANMASTSIDEMRNAFRFAGGEMAAMGYSTQETMAALAGMSTMGARGTRAGTGLRQAMAKLLNPTEQTLRMFQELGVVEEEVNQIMHDSEGARRPLEVGMQRLADIMRRMPNARARDTMFFQMFGLRGNAPGQTLAMMTQGSERISAIMREYEKADVSEGHMFDRQLTARMAEFDMNVQSLKEGFTDLAIAFGEIFFESGRAGQGMGMAFREMVAGIRIAGNLNNMTGDQRRQWKAMTGEEQRQAIAYRQLIEDLGYLVRGFITLTAAIARFMGNHPSLLRGLIGLKVAMSLFALTGATIPGMLTAIGVRMQFLNSSMGPATRGMSMFRGAVGLLSVYLAGEASKALTNYIIDGPNVLGVQLENLRGEYDQLNSGAVRSATSMADSIPIIGPLVSQYVLLAAAIKEAVNQYNMLMRRMGQTQEVASATAQDRMDNIMERRAAAGGVTANNQQDVFNRERSLEESRSIGRLAALMHAAGRRDAQSIGIALKNQGFSPNSAREMADRLVSRQRSETNQSMMSFAGQAADPLSTIHLIDNFSRFDRALTPAIDQVRQFSEALTISNVVSPTPRTPAAPQVAGDAFIHRSGLIRATAGDVLANRSSLASAVTSAPGQMTGEILGAASNRVDAPSARSGGGGGSTVVPTVVVQIDGREVARAVGNQHARHLERSGAPIDPGQRRTMRETGFPERLG